MLTTLATLLTLALCLLAGGADAGEELMAMRAPADAGRTAVVLPGKSPAEVRFEDGPEYVKWRNSLLHKPLLVAGGSLEAEPLNAYAAAQPYVRMPEQSGGFLALLGRELLRN